MTAPAHRLGGVACIVLALMCFSTLDTITKYAAATAPLVMVLWLRYVVQTVLTGAWLWPGRRGRLLRTRMPMLQVLRGLLLLCCSSLAFFSLQVMQVGEFTAIVMLTPLLLTVIAAASLNEAVSRLRWLCVLVGFAGTLIVIRPGKDLFHWAMLLPLVLVGANAAFQILTSRMARTEDAGTMHFYTGLVGLLVTSAGLPLAWQALPLTIWIAVGVVGVLGTLGHILLIMAYGRAPVAVLTPYLYLQIGFGGLCGWLAFGHVPDGWSWTGITLVAVSGVFGTWLTGHEALATNDRREARSTLEAMAGADGK